MKPYSQSLRANSIRAAALGLSILFPACGGSGSESSGAQATFNVVSINVPNSGTWQLNRQIEVRFSEPVDFSSVSLSTISVFRVGGGPATGDFFVKKVLSIPGDSSSPLVDDPTTVVFQPSCPLLGDFSDAGLLPGGIDYRIFVAGSTGDGLTCRSVAGDGLSEGQTVNFRTPNSSSPTVLFIDAKVTPPAPRVKAEPSESGSHFSRLEISGDADNSVDFVQRPDIELGAGTNPLTYLAPLNLYSDVSSGVDVIVEIDQPINPVSSNVNPARIKLEYQISPGVWRSLPHSVRLIANCTQTGATLRLEPTGILPQNRIVRVVLSRDFQDLVGTGNLLDVTLGSFTVQPGGSPSADDFTEPFTVGGSSAGSIEDTTTVLDAPPAEWANGGQLKAGFAFTGTGGPGGHFTWIVEGSSLFSTTFEVINGFDDPDGDFIQGTGNSLSANVVGGQLNLSNMWVKPGAELIFQGVNPVRILATGRVRIEGKVTIDGANNRGVVTFGTGNLTESGATGHGGGGRGGNGNLNTTQSTPKGQDGFGPFDAPGGGGTGGETGFNGSATPELRRGAGGGGGALANFLRTISNPNCPEQFQVGLDAEDGFPGATTASGAINGPGQRPAGGLKGPTPFVDTVGGTTVLNTENDFWGRMRRGSSVIIVGELVNPRPGAGGGGGGNCSQTAAFPTNPWTVTSDEKGAGAGGAAGTLTILALGDIIFGANGRITADGGTGGGGENSNGINRIGSGSGAGSGGHIVLQTASKIDMRLMRYGSGAGGGIFARGGNGGEGAQGVGGAGPGGVPSGPTFDMLPVNSYGATAACPPSLSRPNPATSAAFTNTVGSGGPIVGCGGDGGPGILQLHAPTLADILKPVGGAAVDRLDTMLIPYPVGSYRNDSTTAQMANVNEPLNWDQMLPIFGRITKSQSNWIALGATFVPPTGTGSNLATFSFGGTDALGHVLRTGTGSSATVTELDPILSGTIANEPSLPYVTTDDRTVVFDGTGISDAVYLSNPGLLKNFDLKLVQGTTTQHFTIASATYESGTKLLRVTVDGSGTPLAGFNSGTGAEIRPRFFRVSTNGTLESLPSTTQITFEFQAAPATPEGLPNETLAFPSSTTFTPDITTFNTAPGAADFRFFRFRVTFDISANGDPLTVDTSVPSIDFLKVPFRF